MTDQQSEHESQGQGKQCSDKIMTKVGKKKYNKRKNVTEVVSRQKFGCVLEHL